MNIFVHTTFFGKIKLAEENINKIKRKYIINMKVVQIIPCFGLAGAEVMCENLSYELEKLGHKVLVISLYNYHSPITERLEKANIQVKYLNKKLGIDFSMIIKLYKILKKEKPHVVHTHLAILKYVIPAASFAGIKTCIHTVHNEAVKESLSVDRKINKIFFKYFHVTPVALSPRIKETILEEYHLDSKNVPIIFNGIDMEKCNPKTDYSIKGKFIILNIARLSEQKNHLGLLSAFKIFHSQYSESVLRIIGDGEQRTQIEEFIKVNKLEDCVELLGLKSEVYEYLHDADIFALTSLYEGMPMTILEAMGTGLPIVATPVGGIPDVLKHGENAWLVSVDADEIADIFLKTVKDIELRKNVGKNALEASKKMSAKYMAEKYIQIYKKEPVNGV